MSSNRIHNDTSYSHFLKKREISSLLDIRDAYPKILIVRTRHETYQYEGVKIIDIYCWLSE